MTIRKFKKIHYTYQNIKWLIDFIHANLDKYCYNNGNAIVITESRNITTTYNSLCNMYCSSNAGVLPSSHMSISNYNHLLDTLRKVHDESEFDPLFDSSIIISVTTKPVVKLPDELNEYSKPENLTDLINVKAKKESPVKIKIQDKFYKVKSLYCGLDDIGNSYYGFDTIKQIIWVKYNSKIELQVETILGKSTVAVSDSLPYSYFQ